MISSTSDRRRAIMDSNLLPMLDAALGELERAEEAREEALGGLKAAKALLSTVNADMRHVGGCRDIACKRCGKLYPSEAD